MNQIVVRQTQTLPKDPLETKEQANKKAKAPLGDSDKEKQVWNKYRALTNQKAAPAKQSLQISKPDAPKIEQQKKTITPAGKDLVPAAGITNVLQEYERRKARRAQMYSLGGNE